MKLRVKGVLIEIVFLLGLSSCGSGTSDPKRYDESDYEKRSGKSQSSIGTIIIGEKYLESENANNCDYSSNYYENMTTDELVLLMAKYYEQWENAMNQGNFEDAEIIGERLKKIKETWEDKADMEDIYKLMQTASN